LSGLKVFFEIINAETDTFASRSVHGWIDIPVPSCEPAIDAFQEGLGSIGGQALKFLNSFHRYVVIHDFALESWNGLSFEIVSDRRDEICGIRPQDVELLRFTLFRHIETGVQANAPISCLLDSSSPEELIQHRPDWHISAIASYQCSERRGLALDRQGKRLTGLVMEILVANPPGHDTSRTVVAVCGLLIRRTSLRVRPVNIETREIVCFLPGRTNSSAATRT
jgi:hypothetical protein